MPAESTGNDAGAYGTGFCWLWNQVSDPGRIDQSEQAKLSGLQILHQSAILADENRLCYIENMPTFGM